MMAIFSRDETYIYDRREWSMGTFVFMICFCAFFILLFQIRAKDHHKHIYFTYLCFAAPFFVLADNCSLRISVTASKVIFRQGFFFSRRTVSYGEIADIVFKNSSKFIYRNRTRSFRKQDFAAGFKRSRFIINLCNNDYLIIDSMDAQEILDAIKKVQPQIKDRLIKELF
ncbi:MAG: hypothetical protein FWG71_00605 [Synergistaceae bacterium]|nr:hypothetical protein [Synergistaceae bacterium]